MLSSAVHPPRHLRVHMTARFLYLQGFRSDARELVWAWDAEHGSPEQANFVMAGAHQAIPLESLVAMGDSIAEGIYHTELQTLAGHRHQLTLFVAVAYVAAQLDAARTKGARLRPLDQRQHLGHVLRREGRRLERRCRDGRLADHLHELDLRQGEPLRFHRLGERLGQRASSHG